MGLSVHQPAQPEGATLPPRGYAWIVFACTFGLLLSDYMSRQVLNAVFPLLKQDWGLSDTELGALSGVVALMVGLLTLPLSILADRWGRVRSIVVMAALWSLATLGCALATGYGSMLAARLCVGIGEAAYGSVGIALILSIFPAHLRATLTGAFMAGGAFGSVLGMGLGGAVAKVLGWRWSFGAMAMFGMVLVLLYLLIVSERRLGVAPPAAKAQSRGWRDTLGQLAGSRAVLCAYAGSGLQLFVMGSALAWIPSFLNRYYALDAARGGAAAAVFVLLGGAGMIGCGIITDRVGRDNPRRKWDCAIAFCLLCCLLLGAAFSVGPGPLQLVLLGAGMLVAAGTSGPAGAMVAGLTPPARHGAAFALLTLVNNLLGLAPGPFVTGALADRIGLAGALQMAALVALAAAVVFTLGRRHYEGAMGGRAARPEAA